MSIRPSYFELLDHLGATVPLREFHVDANRADVIGLRHDVDHDLDLALEMAHHEHARGVRATYFLLHTAAYWRDPHFAAKCRQLAAYGHEIGLHSNPLTLWSDGEADDPDEIVRAALARLRACGLRVDGVAAHGDQACYRDGFINYWMWRELRGEDPAASQRGVSAEGVPVDVPEQQIPYPADHRLVRKDGRTLGLWASSLADHRLIYDAAHLHQDHYWTDSGGSWARSGDPTTADVRCGRHQVLVHPWWWRGPTKTIFVLSPARSGSKWLTRFVDRATSAAGLHEWTLNHRREGNDYPADHRTGTEFPAMLAERREAVARMRAAEAHHRVMRRDVIECNVYLEALLPELVKVGRGAELVHLHRDPRDVLRSILERDWYAVPRDHRHRDDKSADWSALDQLERAARYVRSAHEAILAHTQRQLSFESMTNDPEVLPRFLAEDGICVHPLLAAEVFDDAVNPSQTRVVPPFQEWPADLQARADVILHPIRVALGYASPDDRPEPVATESRSQSSATIHATPPTGVRPRRPRTIVPLVLGLHRRWIQAPEPSRVPRPHHCSVSTEGGDWTVTADPDAATAHVVLGDAGWHEAGPGATPVLAGSWWYRVKIPIDPKSTATARVFLIGYDADGRAVGQRHEATIRPGSETVDVSFIPAPAWTSFAVALHLGRQPADRTVIAGPPVIQHHPLPASHRITDQLPATRAEDAPPPRPTDSSIVPVPSGLRGRMRAHHARKKHLVPADYERLLGDFTDTHESLTLCDYVRESTIDDRRILLLRHDVDHDDETALAMARWERDRGLRATYCLLHTAWYWGERRDGRQYRYDELVRFGDALLELGHEINLHNNAVTVALTEGADAAEVLAGELDFMRSRGWTVTGTAAHGDRLCRELQYNNAEIFEHAVKPAFGGARTITGPKGSVELGSLSSASLNLEYEAYDIARDLYLTDSGGRVRGQRNAPGRRPFARQDPARSRVVGMLTHPIWWDFSGS